MDIEGTTTSIEFVHKILFPYATKHLSAFVRRNLTEFTIAQELASVRKTVQDEENITLDEEGCIQKLLEWIESDRKHTALKTLQGYLWREGYETQQYRGHLYDDVLPAWKKWIAHGITLGIYSSGSVEAQKLLFGHSEAGDLTPYLSSYFDTKIGHKRESDSYRNIQKAIALPPKEILFLSDIEAELDAAKEAGFQAIQLLRPGNTPSPKHQKVFDFSEIDIV